MTAMTNPDLLIIGANGLVGRRLGRFFSERGDSWMGTRNKRGETGLLELDITDSAGLAALFFRVSPRAVFACANLAGGVDFCERNPEAAAAFHLEAVKNLGGFCGDKRSTLFFISTDYVFDGTKGPYKEDDEANPLNVYGKLKLEAENWIKTNLDRYVIVRTTNIYGWDPLTATPNYMMQLYRTLTSGKVFDAPSFLWGNPTYVGDLALALAELLDKGANGVYHIVGSSFINRFEWAIEACGVLEFDRSMVREIKNPPQTMIPRPLKSNLDTSKFGRAFKTVLHDSRTGLKFFKSDAENR